MEIERIKVGWRKFGELMCSYMQWKFESAVFSTLSQYLSIATSCLHV